MTIGLVCQQHPTGLSQIQYAPTIQQRMRLLMDQSLGDAAQHVVHVQTRCWGDVADQSGMARVLVGDEEDGDAAAFCGGGLRGGMMA